MLPFVEFEDEATGIIFDHVPAGYRETLRSLSRVEAREGLLDVFFHFVWMPVRAVLFLVHFYCVVIVVLEKEF